MTRAVIYARYSTDLQREASVEDQIRSCCDLVDREGWTLTATYCDQGISGATTLRPGYQQLLTAARTGAFDVLVAEGLDRLSRDQEDVAALYKQLSFAGVRLITLAEGEISELHVGLKGTMNALFLKDLAQKTRRGLEGRVRQGRSGGGLSYGYDVVREADNQGNPVAGGRRVNDAEAAVVRRIFHMFAGGRSPRAIAAQLNAEGVPGPRGRLWSDTTIRGHHSRRTGLLHNDLYAGLLVWNKQRYVKDPSTGKRLARPNPRDQWITRDVPDLRIVDAALWQRVQERLQDIRNSAPVRKARSKKFWEHRRPRHLLTGLVTCGLCGGAYVSIGRNYMGCSRARRQGNCANKRGVPRPVLESLVLDGLKDRLMAPDLAEEFIDAYHQEANRLARHNETAARGKRRELAQVRRKLDGLVDAIAEGLRADGLQARLDDLERRQQALEADLASTPTTPQRFHPNLAALYRSKVEAMHVSLSDPATRPEALEILRHLIESVAVHPTENGVEIELVGEIAHLVSLGNRAEAGYDKAALDERTACSIKLVAGAGFGQDPTVRQIKSVI